MQKGCTKKIYHVKNLSGKYFEEAYLVIRPGISSESTAVRHASRSGDDMAAEAERIIREAERGRSVHGNTLKLTRLGAYALGAASSSALIGVISLLIGLA